MLTALNHVNIFSDRLDETVAFYSRVLGMVPGWTPDFPVRVQWLYVGDQALVQNRIFGTFDNLIVNGVLNPSNYAVIYDQINGNILLAVPEPASFAALITGAMLLLPGRRRRI